MSIRIMNRVWDLSQAEGGALLALLALADNATDEGYAWPSITSIAQRARLKERQTSNVLARLKADGEIDYIVGRGRGRVSVYVILIGLSEAERAEKMQGLQDKSEEIMHSLQVKRDKKAQRLRVSAEENMQSAKLKHAMPIAELPAPTPEPALIRHGIRHDPESQESISTTPPPPTPSASAGGGGAALLAAEGFSDTAVREFGHYPPAILAADIQRRRAGGSGNGAIVKAWRVAPPGSETLPPVEATPRRHPGESPDPETLRQQLRGYDAQQRRERLSEAEAIVPLPSPARPRPATAADRRRLQIWQLASATLQQQLARADFDAWVRGAELVGLDGAAATIAASSAVHQAALAGKLAAPLRRALADALGQPVQLTVVLAAPP